MGKVEKTEVETKMEGETPPQTKGEMPDIRKKPPRVDSTKLTKPVSRSVTGHNNNAYCIESFSPTGLHPTPATTKLGYLEPTPVQKHAIPIIWASRSKSSLSNRSTTPSRGRAGGGHDGPFKAS